MAKDTEKKQNYVEINGRMYYRMRRKVGMEKNRNGLWVSKYKTFYGKTKKEATQKYEAYIGKTSLEADKSLGELMESYINLVFLPDSSVKDTTKSRYINAYNNCFGKSKLSEIPLTAITGLDIQSAINNASVQPSSVKQACNLLKRFYKFVASQHIAGDVTQSLVLPVTEHRRKDQQIEIFNDTELKAFIERTPKHHRLRLLVFLGIYTGARVSELLALKYSDFKDGQLIINKSLAEIDPILTDDEENRERARAEVSTTKSQTSDRQVPLRSEVLEALEVHRKWHTAEMKKNGYDSPYVFTTASGSLYFKSSVRTAFTRLCRQVGVDHKGFHTFRRTFGSKLASAEVPIQTLCALMGHSDISVTARYYINVPSSQKTEALGRLIIGDQANVQTPE